MRGVVGGAMVAALEERGLLRAFDSIHGSSAGACAAAYFSTGQARLGVRIFYEDINNRTFVDPWRLLRLRPVIDKDFLIDCVMRKRKVLNAADILNRPGFLNIITTDSDTGREVKFNQFRSVDQLFQVLKATVCMPVLGGPAVEIDGLHLFDGGMVQQIPIGSAIEAGATHVIVLMTRKANRLFRKSRNRMCDPHREVVRLIYGNTIADLFRHRNDNINAVLEEISLGSSPSGARIDAIVRSAGATDFSRFTTDAEVLKNVDSESREAIFGYIDDLDAKSNIS